MDSRRMNLVLLMVVFLFVFVPLAVIACVFLPWSGLWKAATVSGLYLFLLFGVLWRLIRRNRGVPTEGEISRVFAVPPRAAHLD